MATLYKVRTGYEVDEMGYPTTTEKAKYFFNKNAAEAFYKTGEFTRKITRMTTTYEDGYVSVGTTGANWYEHEKKNAGPNTVVELIEEVQNYYTFETIFTEDEKES